MVGHDERILERFEHLDLVDRVVSLLWVHLGDVDDLVSQSYLHHVVLVLGRCCPHKDRVAKRTLPDDFHLAVLVHF